MALDLIPFKARLPMLLAVLLVAAPSARAALVTSSETTNQGGVNASTGPNTVNILSAPGTSIYGNTLSGGLANLVPPPASAADYNFYDDFIINIPTAGVNSISSTIDFGNLFSMSSLQVRLYAGSVPTLLPPSVIDGWSSPITAGSNSGIVSVLPTTALAAGDYILEIRGLADGQFGGSYSGVLNVSTVPLPASVLLLVSALGGLGFLRRRNSLA